jgi:hypothetical protein
LASLDRVICLKLDVTDRLSIANAVAETIARLGAIDVLVNNAGNGGFVRIAGSTMVGDLILNTSTPSVALQASSKGYVDTRITSLSSTVNTKLTGEYLARAGGTMLGTISMNGNKILGLGTPAIASDAATKGYVDTTLSTATSDAATNTYVNQQDALRVAKAGDTMSGRLAQSDKGFHSAVRDNITTRIDSGFYQTSVAKKSTGWPADTNGWYHLLTSTHFNDSNYYSMQFASQFDNSNELYYRSTNNNGSGAWNKIFHSGNTNTRSLIGYDPVNKAGDTLTGFLNLHSNPTLNAHAANKAYVDLAVSGATSSASGASSNANTRLLRAGDTITGILIGGGSTKAIGTAEGGTGAFFEQRSEGSGSTANAAYITFHRPNSYAVRFGLDTDNVLKVGGWSMGAVAHTIITSANIASFAPTATQLDAKVNRSGDTLTGFLNLHSNPTVNAHAANKAYVDTQVATKTTAAYVDQEAAKRVLKTGDTMSGNLSIQNASPTLYLLDTDNRSSMIHCNSNLFYILRGNGNNSVTWDNGPNNRHPMTLNLENGNVVFSGDVTAYSDSRLKKNINPIENALDKTLKLEGVSYERTDSDDKHIGLIAQKVKEVLPEVVNEDKDGYFTVSYGNIVGLLVEAIKELNAKVEKLENKNI